MIRWACNNAKKISGEPIGPAMSDAEFWSMFDRLSLDDVARLTKDLE